MRTAIQPEIPVGERIRSWRKAMGRKQKTLAKQVRMSAGNLCSIESGKYDAKHSQIVMISRALGITVQQFYGDIFVNPARNGKSAK